MKICVSFLSFPSHFPASNICWKFHSYFTTWNWIQIPLFPSQRMTWLVSIQRHLNVEPFWCLKNSKLVLTDLLNSKKKSISNVGACAYTVGHNSSEHWCYIWIVKCWNVMLRFWNKTCVCCTLGVLKSCPNIFFSFFFWYIYSLILKFMYIGKVLLKFS